MRGKTVAAGEFYPSEAEILSESIEGYLYNGVKRPFVSAFVPYGYVARSGAVTVCALSALKLPDTVILTGVNLSGFGESISVWAEGAWKNPFCDLEINFPLALAIIKSSSAKACELVHVWEYSIETVDATLKYFKPEIKIFPTFFQGAPISSIRSFAGELSKFIGRSEAGLITWANLKGFGSSGIITQNDKLLIDAILSVDGEALYEIVMEHRIDMESVYSASASLLASSLAGPYPDFP